MLAAFLKKNKKQKLWNCAKMELYYDEYCIILQGDCYIDYWIPSL